MIIIWLHRKILQGFVMVTEKPLYLSSSDFFFFFKNIPFWMCVNNYSVGIEREGKTRTLFPFHIS